ncbi:MAG: adenylate/guanylate cyclase domain-containing protein [Phycisphaerales bacterium]|nr:MAG: adenylate/guanylate cyclase domain-containing protein [Phycisphaerales bacterium]
MRAAMRCFKSFGAKASVSGKPRNVAAMLESGICRMRWVLAFTGAIKLIDGAFTLGGVLEISALGRTLDFVLTDAFPVLTSVVFLVLARGVLSVRWASLLCVGAVLGYALPVAVGVGLTGADQQLISILSGTLLVLMIITPLPISTLIVLGALSIGVAVAIEVSPLGLRPASFGALFASCWFPAAMIALGSSINHWHARNFRMMWLAQWRLRRQQERILREQALTQRLLVSVLPEPVARELQETGACRAQLEEVCIISCDIVRFSEHCARLPAQLVVEELRRFRRGFDECCAPHNVETMPSQGDGMLGVAGLWSHHHKELRRPVIDAVLAMLAFTARMGDPDDDNRDPELLWAARIGVHVGPVVTGVINAKRLAFDVWGETVNIAARVQQGGRPRGVLVSERALWATRGVFEHAPLREIQVKNSRVRVGEVTGIAAPFRDAHGAPNDEFRRIYRAEEHPLINPDASAHAA